MSWFESSSKRSFLGNKYYDYLATLMNDAPIESISKMLGHTKLSTTMIYARVTQAKIGIDMSILQEKFNKKAG